MNLLVLVAIIWGTLCRIEAALTFNGYGNINEGHKVEGQTKERFRRNGNKDTLDAGFNINLERSYGRNTWLLPNSRPSLTNGSPRNPLRPQKNYFNLTNPLWNLSTNLRPTYPAVTGNSDDIDPEVAKQYPELVDLLDRLKELNKLKEEGKLALGGNKPVNGQNNKPNNGNTDHKNNGTTQIPDDKGDEKNKDDKPTDNGTTLTVISDGKVYFQVQPVVPENERKKYNETVYYVKS